MQPAAQVVDAARQAFGVVSVVASNVVTLFRVYHKALFWVVFKLTALSINAVGAPYSGLPPTISSDRLANLSPPVGHLVHTEHPYNHGSYYAYDDAFTFVYTHNSIVDFVLSNVMSILSFFGWIDPHSQWFRFVLFLCSTSAYTSISNFMDFSFFFLSFVLVIRRTLQRCSRLPRKLWRRFFPQKNPTPWRRIEGLDALTKQVSQLTRVLDQGAGLPSQPTVRNSLRFLCEPFSWVFIFARALVLAYSWPSRLIDYVWNAFLFLVFYFPYMLMDAAWPDERPEESKKPVYSLNRLDFSSRTNLIVSLAPQIRHNSQFDPVALYDAIAAAATTAEWSYRQQFAQFRSTAAHTRNASQFLTRLLVWHLPKDTVALLSAEHRARALALREPATTYQEAREVLRTLDCLPFIQRSFAEVFRILTTTGALSDPAVKDAVTKVYETQSSYFRFFQALDARWWKVAANVPGRPSRMPKTRSFIRGNNFRQLPHLERVEAAAVDLGHSPEASSTPLSLYSSVLVAPQNYTTVAYWDLGSRLSFVSPALVKSLGLPPVPSGRPLSLQIFGSGPTRTMEQRVTFAFTIPGLSQHFEFEFVVYDSRIAPIVLGQDFWVKYKVLYEASSRFELAGESIPTLSHSVSALDFEPDTDAPEVLPNASPEFSTMLQSFRSDPVVSSLPPTRPDDYRIRI